MPKKPIKANRDRRSKYTCNMIKDSLLELLTEKEFEKISVTELCKLADINRGTFYLHYYDTYDVLDELLTEALEDTSGIIEHVLCPNNVACTYPLCEKIQNNPKYHPLFLDDYASSRILDKISETAKETFITYLMQHSQLTFEEAEAIFYFQMNGCLSVNRRMLRNHCMNWRKIQTVIDQYIKAGLTSYLNSTES